MAADEQVGLVRYVTEGDLLTPVGSLRITISLSAECRAAMARSSEQLAILQANLRGQAVRRRIYPSDERATIIDQE